MSSSLAARSSRAPRVLRRVAPPVLLVLAAACSDGATPPDAARGTARAEPFDASRVAATMALVDRAGGSALGTTAGAGGTTAALPANLPMALPTDACAWTDAEQAFFCAPVVRAGIRIAARWIALDAAGRPLREPTTANTAALRVVTTMTGTLDPSSPELPPPPAGMPRPGPATIDMTDDRTVSGLLAGRPVLDGTSTSRVQTTVGGQTTRSEVRMTSAGLVLPAAGQRWFQGGTATTEVFDPARPGTATLRQVMTFDGTSLVRVVTTWAGGTPLRCVLDLAAPPGPGAFSCG